MVICYVIIHSIQHIKPVIHSINVSGITVAQHFFEILEFEKAPRGGGLEMISEKSLFHPHGSLRAGYAKWYTAHLLCDINNNITKRLILEDHCLVRNFMVLVIS